MLIAVICLLFNGQILGLIFGEVEESVMANAKQYFFFSAISYPFIALYDDGSCILRAQENSSLPMKISICSNIVNAVLNIWFVWGLHFGVAGSACATMLARLFAMFVVMYKLRKPDLEIPVYDYFTIRPQWKEIRRILNIGIPSGIENSMFQFGKLAIQSTVSLMGMAAIAAQGMANLIENLNGILAIGVGVGLMTVVGESLGAGRKDEAIYYVKKLSIVSEVVIVISCLVMYILVYPITKFGGNGSGECKTLYSYGNLDHDCQTCCMGIFFHSGIWIPCGWRCEVYNDRISTFDVVLQSASCNDSRKRIRNGTDGGMDRNVCRLVCTWNHLCDSAEK